jgi:hypothetical protein
MVVAKICRLLCFDHPIDPDSAEITDLLPAGAEARARHRANLNPHWNRSLRIYRLASPPRHIWVAQQLISRWREEGA